MRFELECVEYDTALDDLRTAGRHELLHANYVTDDRQSVFAVIMAERGIEVVKIIQPHVEYLAMKLGHPALHDACRMGAVNGNFPCQRIDGVLPRTVGRGA